MTLMIDRPDRTTNPPVHGAMNSREIATRRRLYSVPKMRLAPKLDR
jgi:hypothetical protein